MKKRKIDIVSIISNIFLLVGSIFMLINAINEKPLINKWIIGPIYIVALIGLLIPKIYTSCSSLSFAYTLGIYP